MGLAQKFDTSERGLTTSAIGAIAGGLIGDKVGHGGLATVAGVLVGALGANAWERREGKKKEERRREPARRSRSRARSETRRNSSYNNTSNGSEYGQDKRQSTAGGYSGPYGGRGIGEYGDDPSDGSVDSHGRTASRRREKERKRALRRQREAEEEEKEGPTHWGHTLKW